MEGFLIYVHLNIKSLGNWNTDDADLADCFFVQKVVSQILKPDALIAMTVLKGFIAYNDVLLSLPTFKTFGCIPEILNQSIN